MSKKLWDVIIVGGGPAGITAALKLARRDIGVLVVEAAVYPGAENWSGAVYFAENLADPAVLGLEELERAPYERRVVKRGIFSCNGPTLAGAEYRNVETFKHCYTVLRPVYDRYLAERARQLGATILNETTVDGLIRHGERVIGVHTDRGPLYGDIVFVAEGDASHLVSKEGFEREAVRARKGGQPSFLQGVKEVIELDTALIEERFGVQAGEACAYEVMLRNGVVDGRPVRLNMAAFIYTNRTSLSVGLVLPLDNLAAFGGDYNNLMEWFKDLPPLRRLFEGGESTSYGAKIIRGGGIRELPRLVDHGVAIGGAATGIGIDFPYPNFTGPATAMGSIFADAVLELRRSGGEASRANLEELYVKPLKATHYYKNVQHLRDWPAFIENSKEFFGRQVDLANGSLYMLTRRDISLPRKSWELTRLVGETLKGKWFKTIVDLHKGSKALRIGRYVLKHLPVAVLTVIPNTFLTVVPMFRRRSIGQLRFSFWAQDERTGTSVRLKWPLSGRISPALSRAAHVLYANDDRSVGQKLDRCVGIVMRTLSLWDILAAILAGAGFALTRAVQRASDLIRYAIRKPTLEELKATYYGRWLLGWRSLTDLAPPILAAAKSLDAKLGEISYNGEDVSHIKVFFPPDRPGALEDPSLSSLWSICPAAVYQINLDRTLHASVKVNYENCVKCETCWRIEPEHVDWTRFGHHRLIYEVYTSADGALRRIISEREGRTAPAIEVSFWDAVLSDASSLKESGDAAPADLEPALAAAERAIVLAERNRSELSNDIWTGPRVLQPGQVSWYQSAIEYFTYLADEAAEQALADPIRSWLAAADRDPEQAELMQLHQDINNLTGVIRAHAKQRGFFAAEAGARQLSGHHLAGLRACLERVARIARVQPDRTDPVEALRAHETESPARTRSRRRLREHLERVFDRGVVRRLEHAGGLEAGEVDLLKAAARAALGEISSSDGGFSAWSDLTRDDVLGELARVDPSMSAVVASHLAALAALERAGAPESILSPLRTGERLAAIAVEGETEPGAEGWNGRTPFVLTALADVFVARGRGQVALFAKGASGVRLSATPPIGLIGGAVSRLELEGGGATPTWQDRWSEEDELYLFTVRARDVGAMALGAGTLMAERAIDHARNRIQFPDHFQDMDGRDAVGKFGAVRAHISHIEAGRLAIDTLLRDTPWAEADGVEPLMSKVAITEIFGPDLTSITYRTGQVIGGAAFSEDDIIAKMYRDSSVFPHYVGDNSELNREIGARITAKLDGDSVLAAASASLADALEPLAARPIIGPELKRLRAAGEQLGAALRDALDRAGDDPGCLEVIHDVGGELTTRLYVWARLLIRAHRRLDAALPAGIYVEAAQVTADAIEERLVGIDAELAAAGGRIELGRYVFELGDYPDVPIASAIDFDYERDIVNSTRAYRSGGFLLQPLDLEEIRYTPEGMWADEAVRSYHEHQLRLFRERFIDPGFDPPFERYIEQLHYIPRGHIDWTREQGFFAALIPKEYGGGGRTKADYYNLCQTSARLADVSHTLTIQANTSIGTTPILLGLYQDIPAAERDLQKLLDEPDAIGGIERGLSGLLAMLESPDLKEIQSTFQRLGEEVGAQIGRSRILKKVVFGTFMAQLEAAGLAGLKRDLDGFRKGLKAAVACLDGWRGRAASELEEMPRRRLAHEFYLRLISARMISAFALTEPSAGSDTARIRTEARLDSRRVHTDADGVKYFYLDEDAQEGRRNIADMRRFEFDGAKILYKYSDDAPAAEVVSNEYSYEDETKRKYIYFMLGDRRVDINDMALIRERDGEEYYEFYALNGAKMWITNGHVAGVMSLYARTPLGPSGFMVDTHTEGFLVGKDEDKMGQRGSPTNEITLTNVRIPRECMIGIEGRGQENALETLNVGRAGLCVSAAAGMQKMMTDVCAYLSAVCKADDTPNRYRLGLATEEMFSTEALANELIGLFDDKDNDGLRMESAIGKFFGTEASHRLLHKLEHIYGIDGRTQEWRIEKDRRDGRVLTIYEGTNEVQQFLLVKDLIDMIGPRLDDSAPPKSRAAGSPYADEIRVLDEMLAGLRERIVRSRASYGQAAWQRTLFQPIFFRLARMAVWTKTVDSTIYRAHWIAENLTAEGDATRRSWSDLAARSFVARARRAFSRLAYSFDRDFELLKNGGRPAELALAETVLDLADAAIHAGGEQPISIERTPIDRKLEIVVAAEVIPQLAPRPRLDEGRVAEHVFGLSAGDRRALKLALALKSAAPNKVRVTLISAAPPIAEDQLLFGLAAGADRAILLDTGGERFVEHARAEAICRALRERGIDFDLLLGGASESTGGGRLAGRIAVECDVQWIPAVTDLWVAGGEAICISDSFPETELRLSLPAVAAIAAPETERACDFTAASYVEALSKPLETIPFPADADRSNERFATAAAAASSADGDDQGLIEPERAAEMLLEAGDLGDGSAAPTGSRYEGEIESASADAVELSGVTFVAEVEDGDLSRNARAPLAAAAGIATRARLSLNALVMAGRLDDQERREIAGRLSAHAPFARIVFAENPALSKGSFRAYAEALVRLTGPAAASRPTYLASSPWLADALPSVAEALRRGDIRAEELAGISQVEIGDRDGLYFVRPALERKLRARRFLPMAGEGVRILWCEPEVASYGIATNGERPDGAPGPRVIAVDLKLDYDPQADVLARALADAHQELGVVTLESAEFIIDVGAGLGSGENIETVVDPLREALLELGAPHVEIGASRKVTQDLSWLPDDRQIGQTGVRVNPRILIALGISGAPQHIDYVAERAVIFAFNLDAQAPLMTLNQRRERPKVYPIVGDLFETVPKFIAALKSKPGRTSDEMAPASGVAGD